MTLTNHNRTVTNRTKYNDARLVLVEDVVQKKGSLIKFKIQKARVILRIKQIGVAVGLAIREVTASH